MELYTTILRTDADGDEVEYEAIVHFTVASYTPGCPACYYQRNGDPGWPAEPAEYEFAFESAELDPTYKGLPPLTDAELSTLRLWFEANHDLACERAGESYHGPDPDDARDAANDNDDGWRGLEA
jgi:hypothetical protein